MNAPAPVLTATLPRRRVRTATIVQFLALACIWGSTWIVIKSQIAAPVPPAWSATYRFVIAGACLAGLSLALGRGLRLSRFGHLVAVGVGALQFGLNFNLVYAAERHVASGLVALVFALIVVPNTVLARLFLGAAVRPSFVAGSVLGLGGVALLVGRDLGLNGAGAMLGLGLAVAAVLVASAANVIQAGGRVRALPLEPLIAFTMVYGAAWMAVWAWATAGPPVFSAAPAYLGGLAYLAVVASALAFRLYYALIREIGPARAAYVNVIVPVLALALSTVFEGFAWGPREAVGAALAFAGLVIALRGRG